MRPVSPDRARLPLFSRRQDAIGHLVHHLGLMKIPHCHRSDGKRDHIRFIKGRGHLRVGRGIGPEFVLRRCSRLSLFRPQEALNFSPTTKQWHIHTARVQTF